MYRKRPFTTSPKRGLYGLFIPGDGPKEATGRGPCRFWWRWALGKWTVVRGGPCGSATPASLLLRQSVDGEGRQAADQDGPDDPGKRIGHEPGSQPGPSQTPDSPGTDGRRQEMPPRPAAAHGRVQIPPRAAPWRATCRLFSSVGTVTVVYHLVLPGRLEDA